ncbi:TPM domain-containing protein [Larkinella rosea]|uniref:TPM domain-containing protein n=1 Tax=Larkinella rosea TaxID=2025312 RepID=A0A3P1C1W7_9BACT|nr:TPM domain-containing protein [Larkinella rosea]RRB07258.1 TPM domain-containing protein [Larkinella rosea]
MIQRYTQLLASLLLVVSAATGPVFAQHYTLETVPNPKQNRSSEYVSNPDHMLSDRAVDQINTKLQALEDSTTAQVAVVCLNSIGENVPKDFATALFRKWGLGYQKKNNGLLILLVKDQHRIEMETGYGLEGILTDALCRRIQTRQMVPLAKSGDFDGAVVAGVTEITRLLTAPEAAREVYDDSRKTGPQPLDNSAIFILFLLLIPCLVILRILRLIFKRSNPVADQLEKAVAKSKGRIAWGFLLYLIMPLALGIAVINLREPLSLRGWQILFILYAYAGVVRWDARRRRSNWFAKLFGSLSEPEQYAHLKAAGLNGWSNILLFPIPFGWFRSEENRLLNTLRNHARQSNGAELSKLSNDQKTAFLTDYQRIEQRLNTVDYDVWRNESRDITQVIGYENLKNKAYQPCNKCHSRTLSFTKKRVISRATTEREGRGSNDYDCQACGHHREVHFTLSKVSESASSNSSNSYSSSDNSSSGSSSDGSSSSNWGGGSSGGGGSGSDW